jgi:hypothetical protein
MMSTDRRLEEQISSWLIEDAPREIPDHVLRSTFERTGTTRQRVGVLGALKRVPIFGSNALRMIGAIGIVGLVVIIGLGLAAGSPVAPGGQPSASPVVTSGPTPRPLGGQILQPGTWFVDIATVRVAFDVPDGWESGNVGDLYWLMPAGDRPALLLMTTVTNVHDEPCGDPRSPTVGPSVDDLTDALGDLSGLGASTPRDTIVDGYPGKQLTLTAPTSLEGCSSQIDVWFNTYTSAESYLDFGEVTSIWILDVEGTRLVLRTMVLPDTTPQERLETQQIFDSIRLGPAPRQ